MPTQREKWVTETRESTGRALVREQIPMSAGALYGNLDCSTYISGLGFTGIRTEREISAALRWLVDEGYAERLPDDQRDPDDPPGALYVATPNGRTAFGQPRSAA